MNMWDFLNNHSKNLKELLEVGHITDLQYAEFHKYLMIVASTAECVSQTVREGELLNKNGLVQPEKGQPSSSGNAEARDRSIYNMPHKIDL